MFVPWDRDKIRTAMEDMKEQGVAASNPHKLLGCCKFHETLTGYTKHSAHPPLQSKADALRDEMQTQVYRESRQAPSMPVATWKAFEGGGTHSHHST